MKRVASPLANAPEIHCGVDPGNAVPDPCDAPRAGVRFRDRPAGRPCPKQCAMPGQRWAYSSIPLAFGVHGFLRRPRCRGDGRPLPLPHQGREAAAALRPLLQAARHDARACGSPAPPRARPSRTSSPARRASTCIRPSTRRATGPLVRLAQPACKAGAFKVSRQARRRGDEARRQGRRCSTSPITATCRSGSRC